MHEKIFLFLILLLIPSYAYAQESETVNYDKCEYDMIHQNILRDIRVKAFDINLGDCDVNELINFVKFCKKQTN